MAIKLTLFNFEQFSCTCNPIIYINHRNELEKFDSKKSKNHEEDRIKSIQRLIEKIKQTNATYLCIISSDGSISSINTSTLKRFDLKTAKLTLKLIKKINKAISKEQRFMLITPSGIKGIDQNLSQHKESCWPL
jgi:hypothetical protein